MQMKTKNFTRVALSMGMAVPFVYFGTQLVAALFYPNYSFLIQAASELGSNRAVYPFIFNSGAIITGIFTLIAAAGFLSALRQLDTHPIWAWLVSIAVALNGIGSIWAGVFSLPDPRHGSNPFIVGVFLMPLLLAVALWKQKDARAIKIYLVITNVMFLVLIPIMSGMAGIDIRGYQGLLQRIIALVFFPPIAVGAYFLAKRIKDHVVSVPSKQLAAAD
jgi:hypothetical membrane protein